MTNLAGWQRNLWTIAFCQFIILVGVTAGGVLIPYQVQALGLAEEQRVAQWLGISSSATSIGFAIAVPLWGLFGDRYGRKLSLIRAVGVMTLIALGRALATSPAQLLVLGILQGLGTGTPAASIALVAAGTPAERLSGSMGVLQAAYYAGASIGPLIGGYLGDWLGYRNVFLLAMAVIASAMLLIIALVREPEPHTPEQEATGEQPTARHWLANRSLWPLVIVFLLFNLGLAVTNPIMPLYVQRLAISLQWPVASLAGTITGLSMMAAAVAALAMGHLGQHAGIWRTLIAIVALLALSYIALAMATGPLLLVILLSLQGFFRGGAAPNLNTIIVRLAPKGRTGTALGVTTSAGQVGLAVGPLVGSALASTMPLASIFLVAAATVGAVAVTLTGLVLRQRARSEPALTGAI